jgi:hypothetical protein
MNRSKFSIFASYRSVLPTLLLPAVLTSLPAAAVFAESIVIDYFDNFDSISQTVAPGVRPVMVSPTAYVRSPSGDLASATVVVDAFSTPPSITGYSARLYDNGSDRAGIEDIFTPNANTIVPDIRFDFSFRRSTAMPLAGTTSYLYASLGAFSTTNNLTLHVNSGRALEVRIGNDGSIDVAGGSANRSAPVQFEPFDTISTHRISFFANAQVEGITYLAPDGVQRSLDGYSFSVFLNDALLDENRSFNRDANDNILHPRLGRFGFVTGGAAGQVGIDFIIDDLRVSRFLTTLPPVVELPSLRIAQGSNPGTVLLRWDAEAGVSYRLHYSEDLVNWSEIPGVFTTEGGEIQHEASPPDSGRGFYRLSL